MRPGSVWENKINLVRVCRTGSWETSVTDKLKMSKPHNTNIVRFVPMESPCMRLFSHFHYSMCEAIHEQEGIRLQMSKVPIIEDLHYLLFLSITATSTGNSGHLASHRKQSLKLLSKYTQFLLHLSHSVVILPSSISAYFIFSCCIPTTYPL